MAEPYDPVKESLAVDKSFNYTEYLDNLEKYTPDLDPSEEDIYTDVLDLIDEHKLREVRRVQKAQLTKSKKARSQAYFTRSSRRTLYQQGQKRYRRIQKSEYKIK